MCFETGTNTSLSSRHFKTLNSFLCTVTFQNTHAHGLEQRAHFSKTHTAMPSGATFRNIPCPRYIELIFRGNSDRWITVCNPGVPSVHILLYQLTTTCSFYHFAVRWVSLPSLENVVRFLFSDGLFLAFTCCKV